MSASERDEAARQAWRAEAADLDPAHCVFLDECGAHLAHTRAYARAPRGERAVGRVPRNRGRVTTLLASLTPTGVGPAVTRQGGTTKAAFLAYLRENLAPALEAGQVVLLDNLGAHRAREVRAIVEATGARLVYLPPYSPDLNPIELAFAKVKARLRRGGGPDPGGVDDGHRRRLGGRHPGRHPRFLCPLRVPPPGSSIMTTAIRAEGHGLATLTGRELRGADATRRYA